MKYLSNKKNFTQVIDLNIPEVDDPEDFVAKTDGSISLDFSDLEHSDATGDSRFVVGGRTYFEASVFGEGGNVSSFTFRGFFDKEGYEEPKSTLNKLKSSGWLYVIIAGSVLLVIGAIVLYCYCSKRKEKERQAKKSKHE